jgi:phosphoenolpyruvate-protein kinase (PTS system EI component)
MIRDTASAANAAGLPCSVCGEMASEPPYAPLLIGLGIRNLSMSAFALPLMRGLLSVLRLDEAEALAAQALSLGTAEEIEPLLATFLAELKKRAGMAEAPHALSPERF